MNKYRSHNCSELTESNIDNKVILSGWLHRKRDHGNLLFIDLRDHFGITQCVIEKSNKFFSEAERAKPESVLRIIGKVVKREKSTENLDSVDFKRCFYRLRTLMQKPSFVFNHPEFNGWFKIT